RFEIRDATPNWRVAMFQSAWQRTASAVINPASVANGARSPTNTITVTGALMGDEARATFSLDLQGLDLRAYVSSANTVSYYFENNTGGIVDLESGTLKVRVLR
ncbi:MAG: hypothetical protein M3Q82_10045, partial [Actinomycetota bacterium]|nr:hypothetical protein [Actinomycetota bacterium]